jgi:hypothetical protein
MYRKSRIIQGTGFSRRFKPDTGLDNTAGGWILGRLPLTSDRSGFIMDSVKGEKNFSICAPLSFDKKLLTFRYRTDTPAFSRQY